MTGPEAYVGRVEEARRICAAVTLCLAAAVGCEPTATPGPETATRDTLASGVPRVRGPSAGAWTESTKWTLRELYRVGAVEGDGPDVFGQVWHLELDREGRLYVLDRIAKEVRVFDEAGTFVGTLGREGRGPGEFENPFGMTWDGSGHLWVVDVRLARYSTFDTVGRHIREYPRAVGGYSWPWPGRIARDGRLYEPTFVEGDRHLVALDPDRDLAPVDSFPLTVPAGDAFWNLQDERGLGAIVPIPFAGQAEWVLDPDARLWVGRTDRYELARRDLNGDTLLLVEREVPPVAVTPEERAGAVEALGEFATHPKMELSRIPRTKPYFRRLIPDDSGDLWVLREGEGDRWFFDVFASDGAYSGAVELPVAPGLFPPPLIRGERAVVVTQDSFDTQSVVVFEIDRPGAR